MIVYAMQHEDVVGDSTGFGRRHVLIAVRAADVTLKERRALCLGKENAAERYPSREYGLAWSRMGATDRAPTPAFYNNPKTIDDLIDRTLRTSARPVRVRDPEVTTMAGMAAKSRPPVAVK